MDRKESELNLKKKISGQNVNEMVEVAILDLMEHMSDSEDHQ